MGKTSCVSKAHTLSKVSLKVLRVLYEARDDWAQKRDVPVFHYATDGVLFGVAQNLPNDRSRYRSLFNPNMLVWCRKVSGAVAVGRGRARRYTSVTQVATFDCQTKKNRWLNEIVNKLLNGVHSNMKMAPIYFTLTNNQIKDLAFEVPKDMSE